LTLALTASTLVQHRMKITSSTITPKLLRAAALWYNN